MNVGFIPLDNNVRLPKYIKGSTSIFPIIPTNIKDVYNGEVLKDGIIVLRPLGKVLLGCGFSLKLPSDLVFKVEPYEKFYFKDGLDVKLDNSYVDKRHKAEVAIVVTNLSNEPKFIKVHTKLAYGIFIPTQCVSFDFPKN